MMSLLSYIDSQPIENRSNDSQPIENRSNDSEIANVIEKGLITPYILGKYCMPQNPYYYIKLFPPYNYTSDDIITLYRQVRTTNLSKLELLITQMVKPEFKHWSSRCVLHFESIIKEKNTNINYNYIHSQFKKLLFINPNNSFQELYV